MALSKFTQSCHKDVVLPDRTFYWRGIMSADAYGFFPAPPITMREMVMLRNTSYGFSDYYSIFVRKILRTLELYSSGSIVIPYIDTDAIGDPSSTSELDTVYIGNDVNIYVYRGASSIGYVTTIKVTDGIIIDTDIDTAVFEATYASWTSVVHVSGDIYAISYRGPSGYGKIVTIEVTQDGNIVDPAVDSWVFYTTNVCNYTRIVKGFGNVFIVTFREETTFKDVTVTLTITKTGEIVESILDTYTRGSFAAYQPCIIQLSQDMYVLAHARGISVLEVTAIGNIILLDTYVTTLTTTYRPAAILIGLYGNYYYFALACMDSTAGLIRTLKVAKSTIGAVSKGDISSTIIADWEFNPTVFEYASLVNLGGLVYAIAYNEASGGVVKTFMYV